jgi:hypothetical protein
VYNLTGTTVAAGTDITFNTAGPINGVTFSTGTSTLLLPNTGTYNAAYSATVASAGAIQISLTLNGAVVPQSTVSLPSALSVNGSTLFVVTTPNSVLTLRNTNSGSLVLSNSPNANANLVVRSLF